MKSDKSLERRVRGEGYSALTAGNRRVKLGIWVYIKR